MYPLWKTQQNRTQQNKTQQNITQHNTAQHSTSSNATLLMRRYCDTSLHYTSLVLALVLVLVPYYLILNQIITIPIQSMQVRILWRPSIQVASSFALHCTALHYTALHCAALTGCYTFSLYRNLISIMLHPEAHKRGGYTDMKKVFNMPFFEVHNMSPFITPHVMLSHHIILHLFDRSLYFLFICQFIIFVRVYYVMLYHVMLCYVMLYHVMLCYVM